MASIYAQDHSKIVAGFGSVCARFVEAHGVEKVDSVLTEAANAAAQDVAIAQNVRNAEGHGSKKILEAMHDTTGAETVNTVLNGGDKGVVAMMNALFSGHIPSDQGELTQWLDQSLGGPEKVDELGDRALVAA